MQVVLFVLYAWNAGPVDGTDIDPSVVEISREFPFTIDLSLAKSREGNSEGQQSLDHFEDASLLLFRQRELFKILVSGRRLRHREIRNKDKMMR